jgi:hypothetical protein
MKQNCLIKKPHANVTAKKHDAAKVMLTFCAPLPEKVTGVPSQHEQARMLGMPQSTLATREKVLIKKCWQLFTGQKGVYRALAKRKKGYSKIDKALWFLLVVVFNNQPCIIVSSKQRTHCKELHWQEIVGP